MATSSATPNVESLLDQLRILEKQPIEDESLRERLYEATRKLNWALENPFHDHPAHDVYSETLAAQGYIVD